MLRTARMNLSGASSPQGETPALLRAEGIPLHVESFMTAKRFALILGILILACFAPVLLGFKAFVFRDFGLFGYPLAHYYRESFWRGEIPLWNPLSSCGLPFAAQWNTMVFYPLSLFYLLLPLPWSLCTFELLHLFLGGMGAYFLARRWTGSNVASAFAGIAFTFNGFTLSSLAWPAITAALSWMPWLLLVMERSWKGSATSLLPPLLLGSLQMLTGAAEICVTTWAIITVFWIGQLIRGEQTRVTLLWHFGLIIIGIASLCAVQLLPFLDLLAHSNREQGYGDDVNSMPLSGLLNFLVPLFHEIPSGPGVYFQPDQTWVSSYYVGIGTIALAIWAVWSGRSRRTFALAAIILISLVLSMGSAAFLYKWLRDSVGIVSLMRYPIKFVGAATCLLPFLAAIGLTSLLRKRSAERRTVTLPGAMILLVLVVAIAGAIWISRLYPLEREDWQRTLLSGLSRAAFLFVFAAILYVLKSVAPVRAVALARALLLCLFADLVTHAPWQNPTVPSSTLAPDLQAFQEMNPRPQSGVSRAAMSIPAMQMFQGLGQSNLVEAYLGRRLGLSYNLNLLERIPKVDSFFPLFLREAQAVRFRLFRGPTDLRSGVADAMAISHVTAPGKLFEFSFRSNFFPMISAGQGPRFLPAEQILDGLIEPDFDARKTVLMTDEARAAFSNISASSAEVKLEKIAAHKIAFVVRDSAPVAVVISQTFYHPWRASVDGAGARLWRANHAFQALAVPAGEHRVELRYRDQAFLIGAVISGLSWLCVLGAILSSRRCGEQFFPKASSQLPDEAQRSSVKFA